MRSKPLDICCNPFYMQPGTAILPDISMQMILSVRQKPNPLKKFPRSDRCNHLAGCRSPSPAHHKKAWKQIGRWVKMMFLPSSRANQQDIWKQHRVGIHQSGVASRAVCLKYKRMHVPIKLQASVRTHALRHRRLAQE
jgi:hypothetical protein